MEPFQASTFRSGDFLLYYFCAKTSPNFKDVVRRPKQFGSRSGYALTLPLLRFESLPGTIKGKSEGWVMAGKKFADRIEHSARFLATPTAQQARGYLLEPLETALTILAVFSDGKPHDYEEVAEKTGFHHTTVRQVIRSLERGGYPLQFTYGEVKARTGRKPVAVHLKRGGKK